MYRSKCDEWVAYLYTARVKGNTWVYNVPHPIPSNYVSPSITSIHAERSFWLGAKPCFAYCVKTVQLLVWNHPSPCEASPKSCRKDAIVQKSFGYNAICSSGRKHRRFWRHLFITRIWTDFTRPQDGFTRFATLIMNIAPAETRCVL